MIINRSNLATLGVGFKANFKDGLAMATSLYARVATEIAYKPDNSGLRLALCVHNLTNAKSFSSTTISAGAARATYEEPREFGITVGYDF